MTSVHGISTEMSPWFRMTTPPGVRSLADVQVPLGQLLFRSRVSLFGVVPLGHWDFTLTELTHERGFVEVSPSSLMHAWRHERRIDDCADDPGAIELSDSLRFIPRAAPHLIRWFLERFFVHRHRLLRARFG
jgi:hypothetical protein